MKNAKHKGVIITIVVLVALGILGVLTDDNDESVTISSNENNTAILNTFSNSKKETVITKENYDEVIDKMDEYIDTEEELYYLSYSIMYYMARDGVSSALLGNESEEAMYVNIYGKTVQQLINEGQQLMKDNNITLEEYKKQLENMDEE